MCCAGGAKLAYANHQNFAPDDVAVHQNICADVVHGRALAFKLCSACDIRGLRASPTAVVLKPKFHITRDLTFARAGGHSSVDEETDFPLPPPASSVMCFAMCCYGCCFCGRCTVVVADGPCGRNNKRPYPCEKWLRWRACGGLGTLCTPLGWERNALVRRGCLPEDVATGGPVGV